ncbi:MAG: tRNA (guanosine(37)-N1)-methyltransferase TrmD [Candidatus Cloacimonadota bacterium]|nr:tRNA (guanosine(37)-N1)-methyltransferase TrmD [Candidatus Cloacimonadota bacterium]
MIIDVFTLFPNIFKPFLQESIVGNAIKSNALKINLIDIRNFTDNKHGKVDDYPYGGGAGLVMSAQPIASALEFMKADSRKLIYFTPQGKKLNQTKVAEYKNESRFGILCGHYKDIDQRIRDLYVTEELSVGDYVLSGGELPALIMIDSIARLIDGVIGDIESARKDSFQNNLLGFPCYTRPADFKGIRVPEVLMSGNHKNIAEWHKKKSLELTKEMRPDLLNEKK